MVAAILAEDGQAVEYGQAIVEIDPFEPEVGPGDEGDVA
jgi:multidrug efflux pump subunit AcrA (membrane-fusion protein)